MFHGSLPDSVQQIMGDCIRDWKCTDIYVGCSGNFTIERTAFTKRPVSMKYRGLFQLLNKKQLPGVDENETDMSKIYYNSGYQLNYGAPMGQWTLAEGLELWKKKHSQIGAKEDE